MVFKESDVANYDKIKNKKKTLTKRLKYVIFIVGLIIITGVLFGCKKINCYPQFSIDGTYIGFKCDGEF